MYELTTWFSNIKVDRTLLSHYPISPIPKDYQVVQKAGYFIPPRCVLTIHSRPSFNSSIIKYEYRVRKKLKEESTNANFVPIVKYESANFLLKTVVE